MFDISQARKALQATRAELIAECDANSKLQLRFDQISAQLKKSYPSSGSSDSADPLSAPEDEEVFEDEDDFDGNDFNDAPSFSSERFYRSNNLDSYGNRDNYGSRQPSRDRAPISASSRLDSSARDDRYSRGTKSVDPPTPQRPRQYTAEKPTAERPSNFANSRRATTPRRSNYYDQNKETEQPQSAAARRLSARRAASRTSQSTSNAAEVEASGPLVDDVTVRGNRSPPRFNRRSKLEELDDLFDDSVSAVQPEEYNDEYDSVDPSIEEPEIKR